MIKNVIVINDFDYIQGGASKVAIDTAQALYNKGLNVIFFSAVHKKNNYKFKQFNLGQKECLSDGIKGTIRGLYNFKAAKELKKILKTLDSDNTIIHIHGWTKALSSSVFRVSKKLKFKTVLTLHDYFTICPNGGLFNYKKCEICKKNAMSINCLKTNCDSRNYIFKLYRIVRQFVQNLNIKTFNDLNLINISDFSLEKMRKYFNKQTNIVKINNPISIQKQERATVENNNYYVYVGRISKEKGVDIFCEAIQNLKLKAVVVGDGPEKEKLEIKYSNDKIKFVGWQDFADVNDYMRNAKCLIFSSIWYETAGLTILEALSNGIPCIVSKLTAGQEFIKDKMFLYDGTVKDLKNKIRKIETIDLKKLSKDIYLSYWNNPYDEKKYVEEILKFYNKLM